MPRFQITAEFDLTTEIEPEVSRHSFDSSYGDDFEDNSYWQADQITSSGGSLSFVIEAEDEEDAERRAEENVISDGQEIEDANGITWLTESVSFEVEEIVPPLTVETAKLLVSTWLGEQDIPVEVKEALQFLLARVV
jgi:hypothetical protein